MVKIPKLNSSNFTNDVTVTIQYLNDSKSQCDYNHELNICGVVGQSVREPNSNRKFVISMISMGISNSFFLKKTLKANIPTIATVQLMNKSSIW